MASQFWTASHSYLEDERLRVVVSLSIAHHEVQIFLQLIQVLVFALLDFHRYCLQINWRTNDLIVLRIFLKIKKTSIEFKQDGSVPFKLRSKCPVAQRDLLTVMFYYAPYKIKNVIFFISCPWCSPWLSYQLTTTVSASTMCKKNSF